MNNMVFPSIGIDRHRIGRDGQGITTLVCAYGCPLGCPMCLNPQSKYPETKIRRFTVKQLYDEVKADNLYFLSTGGGITFGGGEPLLYAEFINEFKSICSPEWKINIETSLNIDENNVGLGAFAADEFIVDIKDMNPEIYKAYTGCDNKIVLNNLMLLLDLIGPQRITVRVPLIKNYNTADDCGRSVDALRKMGITRIDRFEYVDVNSKLEVLRGK